MKRFTAYLYSVLGILLSGCSSGGSMGGSFSGVVEDYYESSNPVPVKVFMGNPYQGVNVKSSGAVDSLSDFAGKNILVYAFSTREKAGYDGSGGNLYPEAPDCLIDGKKALLNGTDANAVWEDEENPVYYPMKEYSKWSYDFFAAYLDDAEVKDKSFSKDDVKYDIRLNGMQDIMSGVATPPKGYTFCYESARVEVNPIFRMQHHLVKLHFKVKPGITPSAEKLIRVESLTLEARVSAHMPIASKTRQMTPEFYGEKRVLYLSSAQTGEPVNPVTVKTVFDESLFTDDMIADISDAKDCFLVPPEESYVYTLTLSEAPYVEGDSDPVFAAPVSHEHTLTLPSGNPFAAGSAFNITFEVFGLNEVSVYVELTPWTPYGQNLEFSDDE